MSAASTTGQHARHAGPTAQITYDGQSADVATMRYDGWDTADDYGHGDLWESDKRWVWTLTWSDDEAEVSSLGGYATAADALEDGIKQAAVDIACLAYGLDAQPQVSGTA